jgi:beta-N-acetylhexosaminidase
VLSSDNNYHSDRLLNHDKPPKAMILGVSGISLTDAEKNFFRYANPLGFILFQRNCVNPQQTKNLIKELRDAVGRPYAPVLIDQEGGRVARLKPPHWPEFPPARMIGKMAEQSSDLGLEAAKVNAQLIGLELHELGISVNCAPLADVLFDVTDNAIGDRAYSPIPDIVSECARSAAEGMLWAGILPIIKHIPGHGRTIVDPHHTQSVVKASKQELHDIDFAPFRALRDMPLAMTCHIIFEAYDKLPCSLSPVMHEIIRKEIGFDGLLISDDLNMKGIHGRVEDLVTNCIRAGSDIALHCNGNMSEMVLVSGCAPLMTEVSMDRWDRAQARLGTPPMFVDKGGLLDRLDMLLGVAAITS